MGTSPQARVAAPEGDAGRTGMEPGTLPEPMWDGKADPSVGVNTAGAGWPWLGICASLCLCSAGRLFLGWSKQKSGKPAGVSN